MSTDNKPTVQQAAKQGNPQAIAILLNRQLQPKGITAKVSVKDSCLRIMLEAANVPNQKALVTALQKWIDGLGFDSIQRVQIYAKQTGEDIPEWNDSFEVVRQLEEPKIANTVISPTIASETPKNDAKVEEINTSKLDSGLLELARNGDTKAIAELIKNSLQQTDVKIRATLNKGLLQVVLVSNSVPKQDVYVEAIPNLVKNWESTLIDKLKVVGMREIEGSATSNIYWTQESIIVIPENEPEQLEVNEEEKEDFPTKENGQIEQGSYEAIFDPESSPLCNLQTNLAETAIEELAKVNARLIVSVILQDFPSVVSPAIFAVSQFENSDDFKVCEYLSETIKNTCLIYQILQKCFELKLGWVSHGANYDGVINKNTDLGKYIQVMLPDQPIGWFGNYNYKEATQGLMNEASSKLETLNKLLQVIRQIFRKRSISNANLLTKADPFEQIAKLKRLKDDGIITESEFESKKKDLLDRL